MLLLLGPFPSFEEDSSAIENGNDLASKAV
jgi:hypothetical protein